MEPELSIIICTLRRNDFLRELLAALQAQRDGAAPHEVIVIDNDPQAGARAAIDPGAVRYVHEGRAGVSHARNRGVAEARAATVLFLDDDQLVAPGFLAALMQAWSRRPVHLRGLRLRLEPRFERGVQFAAVHARTLARFGAADFTPVERGGFGTGGLIIERAVLAAHDDPFRPELGISGGEDTDFFLRASERGYHFGHLSSVAVAERVTAERAGLGYLLARQFRAGLLDAALDDAARGRRSLDAPADPDLEAHRRRLEGEREGWPGELPPQRLTELRAALRTTLALRYAILGASRVLARVPLALARGGPAAALELQHLAYMAGRLRARVAAIGKGA